MKFSHQKTEELKNGKKKTEGSEIGRSRTLKKLFNVQIFIVI